MKDNQKSKEYAPMDEYSLLTPDEGAKELHLNKGLQTQVEELLYLHPEFVDEYVHVTETDGKVTLMGRVSTKLDKNLAESLVMELDGVLEVINLLEVDTDANEPWMNSRDGENLTKGLY